MTTSRTNIVAWRTERRVIDPVYRPSDRLRDAVAGYLARRAGVTDPAHSPWFLGMCAVFLEYSDQLLASVSDRLGIVVERVGRGVERVRQLDIAILEIEGRLHGFPGPVTGRLAVGESHLTEAQLDVRRRREHQASRGRVQQELDAARAERRSVLAATVGEHATLVEEWELAHESVARAGWYYGRRMSTFLQILTMPGGLSVTNDEWVMPTPAWVGTPCPWVPVDYDRVILESKEHDDVLAA